MKNTHENAHVFVLSYHVNFKHESAKTCMFPCKFPSQGPLPPLHHNGKGSIHFWLCSLVPHTLPHVPWLVTGEVMEKGLRDCCRSIRIGKILIRRDQETRKPRVGLAT